MGTWKRSFRKTDVLVQPKFFERLTPDQDRSVAEAVNQYSQFLQQPAVLQR